jgi:predicted dehydrogenase
MAKPKVRAGIIGAGFSARFHHEAAMRTPGIDVEVVGVHARAGGRVEAYAADHDLTIYERLEPLLEAVDIVHVCTPPATHEAITISALAHDVCPIVEKPFTGWFGDGSPDFRIQDVTMEQARDGALASIRRMLVAEDQSKARIFYAENWVYAPAIQKEREVIEKTGAQILWIHGEEAHSGSHAPSYGDWHVNGGGALIGKGVHPMTAALYLKRVEGRARLGQPIRPKTITARTHDLTRIEGYVDAGHIRTDYRDVEDFSMSHITFEDNTIATVFASEIVLGGIHNWLEVNANNHRVRCHLNPNNAMRAYVPDGSVLDDVYVVEKTETKQGWSSMAPDEDFMHGFPQEIEAFYRAVATGEPAESDSALGADTIATVYSGYLSAERGGAEVEIPDIMG